MQQQLKELNLDKPAFTHCPPPPLLGTRPETPEYKQFDSTWEDTEGDKGDATSAFDAKLNTSMGKETDTSGHPACTSSANRHRRRNHTLRRECNRACQEFRRPKSRRLSFHLFQETTKEDAISYRDWCSKMEDAQEQGHSPAKVKEAMFTSLEGMARDNTKMIDENGDLHVMCILDRLDSLYGVSMTFQLLNAALCGLQQKPMEPTRTYYNHNWT